MLLLTSCRDWPIVILDLATEDIRACEHRGTTGTLATMKNDSEAPSPGAKLITRRPQVPWPAAWAGESSPRYLSYTSRDSLPLDREYLTEAIATVEEQHEARWTPSNADNTGTGSAVTGSAVRHSIDGYGISFSPRPLPLPPTIRYHLPARLEENSSSYSPRCQRVVARAADSGRVVDNVTRGELG